MVAAAAAVTPGCRVTGLVTAVPRRRRDVARAASVRYDQQLPEKTLIFARTCTR